jgi:hypothetical protein
VLQLTVEKTMKKLLKKFNFIYKYKLLIAIFVGIGLFSTYIYLLKAPSSKVSDIYVTVKLNRGQWWATDVKPGIWFLNSFKKGEKEYDFLKKPIAELFGVRYYHTYHQMNYDLNQFDIYVDVKLAVEKIGDRYNFKRAKIAPGVPIDLDFPSSQVMGTVINVSPTRIDNQFVEKYITLTKKYAYPWEYDAIKIGDKYFDGENNVMEIIDKQSTNIELLTYDAYGNLPPGIQETRKYVTVKVKIKAKKNAFNQLIYAEEQVLKMNDYANFATNNFVLTDFVISAIE